MSSGDPITGPIREFAQTFATPGVPVGGGGGAGRPEVGPVTVELPLTSAITRVATALPRGARLPRVTLEMCAPGQVRGRCVLEVELNDVLLTAVGAAEGAVRGPASATLSLAPTTTERVTTHLGERGTEARSVLVDLDRLTADLSGASPGPAGAGSPFRTRLLGAADLTVPTEGWRLGMEREISDPPGGPAELGAPRFAPLALATASGPGSVDLPYLLFTGRVLSKAEITGCSMAPCTQRLAVGDVVVTEVSIGAPSLTDRVELAYGRIAWERTDPVGTGRFGWNAARGDESDLP